PRSPGLSVMSLTATRSAPASPGCAYDGSGRSGSSRWINTSVTRGDRTEGGAPVTCQACAVVTYRERLRVPVSWWIIAIALAITLFVVVGVCVGTFAGGGMGGVSWG